MHCSSYLVHVWIPISESGLLMCTISLPCLAETVGIHEFCFVLELRLHTSCMATGNAPHIFCSPNIAPYVLFKFCARVGPLKIQNPSLGCISCRIPLRIWVGSTHSDRTAIDLFLIISMSFRGVSIVGTAIRTPSTWWWTSSVLGMLRSNACAIIYINLHLLRTQARRNHHVSSHSNSS